MTIVLVATFRVAHGGEPFPELREKDLAQAEAELAPMLADLRSADDRAALVAQARGQGEVAAWALLLHLQRRAKDEPRWTESVGAAPDDGRDFPIATSLGDVAGASVRDACRRELDRRSLQPRLRRDVVVALSRVPGPDAAEALASRALDRAELMVIRRAALARLHRQEMADTLFERLRWLLYEPRGNLDVSAAAMLARAGRYEAPSLVLEGLRYEGLDPALIHQCVAAMEEITGKRIPLEDTLQTHAGSDPRALLEALMGRTRPHIDALRAWMSEHPGDTRFERERRAYLASDRRRRELATPSRDAIAEHEGAFDLAAAVLRMTMPGARGQALVERDLERLDRLSRLARHETRGAKTPEELIDALNELLLSGTVAGAADDPGEEGVASLLHFVIEENRGNCLGFSILYVAVCDRLGLPVEIMFSPNHAYLRWLDADLRRNIEPLEGGRAYADSHYFAGGAAHPLFRKAAGERSVLAVVCSNVAAYGIRRGNHGDALEWSSRAIRLDENAYLAYLNRSCARFESGQPLEDCLADVDISLRKFAANADAHLLRAEFFFRAGRHEEARAEAMAAAKCAPSDRAELHRLRCELRLGLGDEVWEELRAWVRREPADPVVRRAYVEAAAYLDRNLEAVLADAVKLGSDPLAVRIRASEALCECGRGKRAASMLADAESLVEERSTRGRRARRGRTDRRLVRNYWTCRARLQLKAGAREAAQRSAEAARETGMANRELLAVEREIAGTDGD